MNFKTAKIIFQCSAILAKNHYSKFALDYTNAFQRCNIHCSQTRWFSKKENTSEFHNDFDSFEEAPPDYSNIDYEAVTEGDPEKLKCLKLYQLEIDLLAQQGEKVPKRMLAEHWRELLNTPAKNHRFQYLKFLWLKEVKREKDLRKQAENRVAFLQVLEERKKQERPVRTTSSPMCYGLTEVSLFHRFYEPEINRLYNYKMLQARMFGPQIIVDCSYENYMNLKEINLCAKQMLIMWSENRDCFYPFDLLFCNLVETSPMLKKLRKTIPSIDEDPTFPFNYTPKNYLDLYPKEQLVYLTPHCTETLDTYDGNSVYIIGALVDKSNGAPLSLAKAKRDGIRTAKFPLDNHLQWGIGIKSLTLNQCLAIMNDKKDGRDWKYSFRHIPRRKLVRDFIDEAKSEEKKTKFTAKFVREKYRRNVVYDLLLKDKTKEKPS